MNEPAEQQSSVEPKGDENVVRTRVGVVTQLSPRKELVEKAVLQALIDQAEDCSGRWETQLVLDFTHVTILNSEVLDAMTAIHTNLRRVGGWLKVIHARPLLQEVFSITGMDKIIPFMDVEPQPADTVAVKQGKRMPLGDVLVHKRLLQESQLDEGLRLQEKTGKRLGSILVDKGWLTEKDMLETLGEQLGIPFARLRPGLFDPELSALLPIEVLRRLHMMPLFRVAGVLYMASFDPQAIPSFNEIEERTGLKVRAVLATRENIVETITQLFSESNFSADYFTDVDEDFEVVEEAALDDYSTIDEMAAGSPVINLVNSMIQRAVHDGASDIHIEPSLKKSRIRFRIDGLLYEVMNPRPEMHASIVSRLKVMANLDIAERRQPQDGRIQVHTQGRAVDLRFSSLPGLYGEKVVLRVLDKNQAILDVNKLGMSTDNLSAFKRLLDNSYGLILVTGPTGSGKTTSLYAAINYLNSIEKNIVTIEDPVEYQVDIVNQNEVKENIDLTFAKMLKHVLRQDPDVVMVGEIRERETAEIAVQAALTGHLVLSTLHTNDSIGAITRMIDMGVEPYLLSSALIGVLAQRLVRGICPACKTEFLASPELSERYGWSDNVVLAKGRGCRECYDSGYKSRMGIHEVIETNQDLQKLVISNPGRDELTDYLQRQDINLLFDDGMQRVLEQKTTIEEVSRVLNN